MVRSFNLLRNVGKFDNVAVGVQLPFSRLTVIYAENARGKTTLSDILRSLATGQPRFILERARLGAQGPPHIVVDTGAGAPAVFQDGTWSRTVPELVIFDDRFVAENVHSGIEVGAAQRQHLHDLIVGSQGIALARALQAEVEQNEVHIRALREQEVSFPVGIRRGLTVDAFCALEMVPDLPRLIDEAERRLAAAQEAGKVAETPAFASLSLPKINLGSLRTLLSKELKDLDASALARVGDHFRHLGRSGETWVSEGMGLAERLAAEGRPECPFCGQDLAGSPLITHYRAYFGEVYEGLKREIEDAIRDFRSEQAGDVPAAFERSVREAVERQAFWRAFGEVPALDIDTAAIARTWKLAREQVEQLLETKRAAPLERLDVPAEIEQAIAEHNRQCEHIREVSDTLALVNPQVDIIKEEAREANIATLTSDLANRRAIEARYDPQVAPLCEAYLAEKAAKVATERRRTAARNALDQHREAAFPAYGTAINDFLQRFNASFRLGAIDAVNTRGGSAANYTLLIDGYPVALTGRAGEPNFGNTLSSGDRNTLALAFFFACLQSDPNRAQKVVVI
jgi:wobble nucleotide-excising tRNase